MSVYTRTFQQMLGRSRPGSPIGRVSRIVGHHEAGAPLPATATVTQEVARARAIDAYHRSRPGWQGVGYNVMVCASGRAYELRGYRRSGAHTRGYNTTALAYMQPGNGGTPMTEAQIQITRAWIGEGIAQGHITANPTVNGHRDLGSTHCPGNAHYGQLDRVRGVRGREPTAPPKPTPPSSNVITVGDTGARVREWQRLLVSKGFGLPRFGADGHFGEETRQATLTAYRALGLSASNPAKPSVGDVSFDALRKYNPRPPWHGKRVVAKTRVRFYRKPGWHPSNPTAGFLDAGWGFRGGIHERRKVGSGYQYRVSNSAGQQYWITASDRYVELRNK